MSDDPLSFDRDPHDQFHHSSASAVALATTSAPATAAPAPNSAPAPIARQPSGAPPSLPPLAPISPLNAPAPQTSPRLVGAPVPATAVAAAIEMGPPATVRALSLRQSATQPPLQSVVAPQQVQLDIKQSAPETHATAAPSAAAAGDKPAGEKKVIEMKGIQLMI